MMKLPDAFSPEVLAALARPVTCFDPRDAEIIPDVTPRWHVVETYAHREREVAKELIARRFGIFLPEEEETVVRRGRKIDRVALMFPGYVFVFVWDILQHRSRVESISGVLHLVPNADGFPAVLTDQQIDQIRVVENSLRYAPAIETSPSVNKSKKRRWRKTTKRVEEGNAVVCVRPWSAFQDSLMVLDSEQRNQSLRNALGLSSVPAQA